MSVDHQGPAPRSTTRSSLAADRLGQDDRPGRAIVVVTDGDDVSSLHSFSDAVRAAHEAHAAIYAIGIAGPASTPATLRKLAPETGGSYRQASTSAELAATYAGLRNELARTWQVSYLTSSRPGANVTLTATVAGVASALRRDAAFRAATATRRRRDGPHPRAPATAPSAPRCSARSSAA